MSEYLYYRRCPNCDEEIKIGRTLSSTDFECPKCAAVLRIPKKKVILFFLSFLPYILSWILFFLGVMLSRKHPIELLTLQGDPIIGVAFWIGFVIFLGLQAIAYHRLALQVVQLQSYCGSCGSTFAVEDAHFCLRCGADLSVASSKPISRLRQAGTPTMCIGSLTERCLGICMVCREDVKGNDIAVRCPHCGGLAHETHLLEYLHVHNQCPACLNHLDEMEVKQQLAERSAKQRNMNVEQDSTKKSKLGSNA